MAYDFEGFMPEQTRPTRPLMDYLIIFHHSPGFVCRQPDKRAESARQIGQRS
jgi:hypothetical protein